MNHREERLTELREQRRAIVRELSRQNQVRRRLVGERLGTPLSPRKQVPGNESRAADGMEDRLLVLEAAGAELAKALSAPSEAGVRLSAIETQVRQAESGLAAIVARLAPLENKCEVLRGDLRSLEASATRTSEQLKSFDQLFASLGRDGQKLSNSLDALAVEFRQWQNQLKEFEAEMEKRQQAQAEVAESQQDRLRQLEVGLEKAVGLLENSSRALAGVETMRGRIEEMESRYSGILEAVRQLERTNYPDDSAEREATARVLASLTKLVESMRSSAAEPANGMSTRP